MRILVTGCEGMLGRATVARLGQTHQVQGVDLAQGDLSAPGVAQRLLREHGCQWVVNCAAWTAVDAAETSRQQALAANATAPANLAQACDSAGVGLTHISTDYVFSGVGEGFDEDSPRAPVSHYGATKAEGERAVEKMAGSWQIVRTSWLFGDGPVNFVKTIGRLLGERQTLEVVDDQRGCPTYAEDLAGVLDFLVSGRHRGIFHGTNAGACTWHEFAQAIASGLGQDPGRIRPCPTSAYPTLAVRPACSILRSSRLEAVGCPERAGWPDALSRYLALLASGRSKFP